MDENRGTQALIDVLAGQRNEAMNQLAQATASIVVLRQDVERLTKENEELKAPKEE